MVDFLYYAPTKVAFGKDSEQQLGKLVCESGAKKVLVHFGGKSAKESGLLGRVHDILEEAGVSSVELGGVQPNPRLSKVYEGIELGKKEGVDFVLAVGGGSVIDSAKAIAYGLANEGDVWDYFAGTRSPQTVLPVGVVLTMAAAGSEMSNSTVITNEKTGEKRGFNENILGRPKFAVMNPALTLTVPAYQTACGCADIMMHTLERYFTDVKPTMEITDNIAEALMRTVMANARILTRDPNNYAARAEIMWASSLSHNGVTGCGNGAGDWSCHQISHELSGRFDLAHGAALTAVWGSWARHVYKNDPARFAQLGERVLELPHEEDVEEAALAAIEEMEEFFWAIELPTSLPEASIEADDAVLHEMALGVSRGGGRAIGAVRPLGEKDVEKIFQMANKSHR